MDEAKKKELEELKKARQKELLEKRKKIEELKKKKEERLRAEGGRPSERFEKASIDELLQEIITAPRPAAYAEIAEQHSDVAAAAGIAVSPKRKQAKLKKVPNLAEINIPPKLVESYDKSIQVETEAPPPAAASSGVDGSPADPLNRRSSNVSATKFRADHDKHPVLRPVQHAHGPVTVKPEGVKSDKAAAAERAPAEKEGKADQTGRTRQAPATADSDSEQEKPSKEITDAEKKRILTSPDFTDFFNKTSKLVERALGQKFDVFVDYSGSADDSYGAREGSEKVKKLDVYQDAKWTAGRPVTDVRTSPKFPEVFLASYGQRENASVTDPDGCVLVWSLALTQRPEYTFICQSAVLTATFNKFQPNLIIGGTYSGSIVVWDTRAKAGPIQRTPLTSRGHSHPVFSMQLVGTQNAHNLISVSTDGRLCVWTLGMLVHPQEFIDFKRGNREVAATCLAFAEGETNSLYVGAEDGSVFQAHIHGSKVGVTEQYEAHDGPVTSVDFHPMGEAAQHGADFSDLMLSTSFDWTVKLWSPKQHQQPLHSFEASEDYVYDAKWHPNHPALFASVDGEGHLDVWDLNRDFEAPHVRVKASESALNHCNWSSDGKRLVTGDAYGVCSVFACEKELIQPRPDEFSRFEERILDLKPTDVGGGSGAFGARTDGASTRAAF